MLWSKEQMQKDIEKLDNNLHKIKKLHFKKMVIDIIQKYYNGMKLTDKQKKVLIMALDEVCQDDIKNKAV